MFHTRVRLLEASMPTIIITEEVDRKLEEVAPDYLAGWRTASRRVTWAIHRLRELLAEKQNPDAHCGASCSDGQGDLAEDALPATGEYGRSLSGGKVNSTDGG